MTRFIPNIIAVLCLITLCATQTKASQSVTSKLAEATKAEASSIIKTWADALLTYQLSGTGSPHIDGAFICPACKAIHGRTIDDVWPLVWLWDNTGDKKYLDAAINVVNWGKFNQQKDEGSYTNDPGSGWVGITIFTQTAIGKTLTRFGEKLPVSFRKTLESLYAAQTEYIRIWINIPDLGVNVNYRAAYPLAMEIASHYYHNPALHQEAEKQASRVIGYIAEDGLLYGEADPLEAVTKRGYHSVDMGYNIEETLPALLEYAELAGDWTLLDKLVKCAYTHMDFFLPDGGIDDSFGSRAYKWSYWGSRTSDGCLPMLSALARNGHPEALKVADKVLSLYRRLTDESGLLTGGYSFIESGEPSCIHHTFCHLKTLPDWIDTNFSTIVEKPVGEFVGETAFGVKSFPTTGVHLIGTEKWRATINESDSYFHDDNGKSTGGGSLTLLYHKKLGPVTASSMPKYTLVEKMNMQTLTKGRTARCLTPRIQNGKYMSVYDDQVKVSVEEKGNKVISRAEGCLADIADKRDGGAFALEYTFCGSYLTIEAATEQKSEYILPVIVSPQDKISINGKKAIIHRTEGSIIITSSSEIIREDTDRPDNLAFNPIGGFLAVYLKMPFAEKLKIKLEVK